MTCCNENASGPKRANPNRTKYSYDAFGKLSEARTAQWGLSWTYDRYGNRTAQTVLYGPGQGGPIGTPSGYSVSESSNRVNSAGYAYDASGNLITSPHVLANVYDAENRPTSQSIPGMDIQFRYNGGGQRIQRTQVASGVTTLVTEILGPGGILAEYSGATVREHIYAGGRLIATVQTVVDESVQYLHMDHLSVRLITDANGMTVEERGHYPYGELWYSTGPGVENPMYFTSYIRDPATGEDFAVVRMYVPWEARFDTPDRRWGEVEVPRTWNRYSYAANDPVNNADPSGEVVCWGWHRKTGYIINGVTYWTGHDFFPVRCGFAATVVPMYTKMRADDAARQIFENQTFRKQLEDCINKLFGREAERARQVIAVLGAPEISFAPGKEKQNSTWPIPTRLNDQVLSGLAFEEDVLEGRFMVHINPYYVQANGTYANQALRGAIVHETGNLLDMWVNQGGLGSARRLVPQTYGDPSRFRDRDTGRNLEDCFNGGYFYTPWKRIP